MPFSRFQLLRATTRSPWTRDFRHLLPVPKHFAIKQSFYDPGIKAVRVKDRIKFWNVVPGDRVCIRGDGSGTIHEVLSINKFTNRVYLKGTIREPTKGKMPVNRSVHYSKCQLLIKEMEKKTESGTVEKVHVFARRIGVRDPHWNPEFRRFDWKRVVLASIPAHVRRTAGKEIVLPWPEPETPPKPKPNTLLDTSSETVLKITYQPPTFQPRGKAKSVVADENAYIKTLFNPSPRGFDESQPMELHLAKELSNPHSRAKKQARWQAARRRKSELLKKFVARELLNQGDRTAREARAEAVFKWRQQMEEERKAEKKRRWFTADRLAKLARKGKRKQRKAEKQKEKLTQLVLKDAPNQVIPGSLKQRRA
ncbi:hypothetical protein EDD16DRAFT_1548906 [Pisolithus croceorrhizus]|nr:hypothetical protein EV401DRAFT_1314926 [Pisolithus croceorrhizus]KAI6128494.1 hypothetical protein EDD16DRAFT_1548906 [Pisolithus croceorrhizus]